MKKAQRFPKKFLCLFLLPFLFAFSNMLISSTDMLALRKSYFEATENETLADSLATTLKNMPDKSPVFVAYWAACEGLRAKFVFSPYKKIQYINQAQKIFAGAVQLAPKNIEIRFLRFSMQHNIPAFLGQSKNLEEDLATIVENFDTDENLQIDQAMRSKIAAFLVNSKRCKAAQVSFLKKYIRL
jgi:hypothetical protein